MNVLSPDWSVPPPSGVAIGVFDGVHRGHAEVIEGVVHRSRPSGLTVGVLTFDPHPVEVLAPSRAPLLLMPAERRIELLHELGADWVGVLDLGDIRLLTPEQFVSGVLVARANARLVSVGGDFRFGHDRAGDVDTLAELGRRHGFETDVVDLIGDEEGVISSSRIRRLVIEGEVAEAADLLGRPYRLGGRVVEGDARGRLLGFPTANIVPPDGRAVPADGIYAVRVSGAIAADGVASLGVRPTFGTSGARVLEVSVFDFDGDLYGAELQVDFIQRLRREERFDSVEDLVTQMEKDAADARRVLAG